MPSVKVRARFDFAKLEHLNGHYIRTSEDEFLVAQLLSNAKMLENGSHLATNLSDEHRTLLIRAMPLLKQRAKTLNDLVLSSGFLFQTAAIGIRRKSGENSGC